jgi:N-acetylglucosaminyl-diphospho-decaprenol L-rhamnosyltransferase
MHIPSPQNDPRVGVVVLTHNRAAEVTRTIERMLALPERPPVVVVDNGSTDGTSERLRSRFSSVEVIRLQRNIGAAARNIGVQRCRRPYVALCDDDTWWEPGSLRRAADVLDAHPSVAVVTGTVLVGERERVDPTCLLMARSPLPRPPGLDLPATLGFLAGASLVRRDAFLATGGFDPRLALGGEEELLALDLARAGWALAYCADATIHHYPSPRRDAASRRWLLARNRLWVAWLRRPLPAALTKTVIAAGRGVRDRDARRGFAAALRGIPWITRQRRVIPPDVERRLRLLEQG